MVLKPMIWKTRVLVPNVASVDKLNDFRDGDRVGIYTNIIFVNHVRRFEEWKPYRTSHRT